jgi:hypothetical protein
MKALHESRYGISCDGGFLAEVHALENIPWKYAGQADGSSFSNAEDLVVMFRRSMKLLPIVLGSMDHDVLWVLRVFDAGAVGRGGRNNCLTCTFVMTGLVDSGLSRVALEQKDVQDALLGIWPSALPSLSEMDGGLSEALEPAFQGRCGGNEAALVMSDGLFRLLLQKRR